ncbi:MAG: gamma carbonic anhydrase family protein [Candidatus Abyssobacteria bacterium SURF_5]|uniref:Gamma carbonic anhydrase family protein n=1 Tax=Abyssobacteria bacterium (strain SURF_5) TaxID=2093360 RepID=A0A3A4NDX7_ABYX5|nr:MAG: gamma carbonic anhydrase family protein [Candidatus Abyssubacteria bacterium SURF_5]
MIHHYGDRRPTIAPSAFIAEGAQIIGGVEIGENASIWFNTVLRGDINDIRVGRWSNIQDNSIVHVADEWPCIVGDFVTVGHGVNLHGCVIEDEVMVGMGAIIMNGVVVGSQSIIGAGALIPPNTKIPPRSQVVGVPAKVTKQLSEEEGAGNKYWAEKYMRVSRKYLGSPP